MSRYYRLCFCLPAGLSAGGGQAGNARCFDGQDADPLESRRPRRGILDLYITTATCHTIDVKSLPAGLRPVGQAGRG
jgi:hypothetical protein